MQAMTPDKLKELRKAAGLSQAELGTLIGMARETIGAMERGTNPIERRTGELIDLHLRHRIDVAYSRALDRWTVAVTGPGPAPTGVSRVHEVRGAFVQKDDAVELAKRILSDELPLARLIPHEMP